jgi:tRNA(fMet)-specific endonuclease VapC
MKFLLDTDICIELIRHKPTTLLEKLISQPVGDVGLSAITVAALQHGVWKSSRTAQNADALALFLLPLAVVDFDFRAAEAYGQVRGGLEKAGATIGPLDMLIAAHAVSLEAVLVTNNVAEFGRVAGLRVENWLEA